MKILRWILGFPLATGISLGVFALAAIYDRIGYLGSGLYFFTLIYRIAIIAFCFASWVFLTCFFIPSYKKFAGFVPIALSLGLVGLLLYSLIIDNLSRGRALQESLIMASCMIIGAISGYFVSYQVFKDKNWGRSAKAGENTSADI